MTTLTPQQKTFASGALLVLVGGGSALRAVTQMHVGTAANMGPGFFPLVLGICLVLSGLVMVLGGRPAVHSGDVAPMVNLRTVLFVVLAVAVFALTVRPLGLIPAAFLLVVIAGIADRRSRLKMILPLAAGLALFSWLIFLVGLNMPLPAFAF